MKHYFAYIRVSTARQGTQGVSLEQQTDAITRYARLRGLSIVQWFEERETAAKSGRAVFGQMLARLKTESGRGVIIHKIDRSARNLRDWAALGELIDAGIEVHFANESLDMNSRGGRLSADIQAVVASDFIRNLREETKKGIYGRLKQGFYPMPAPVGYLNNGGGKAKTPDPKTAPLVRLAFELYAEGKLSLRDCAAKLTERGFKDRTGKDLRHTSLAKILHNPFYCGVIRLEKTGETYPGAHKPIVSASLFQRVQDRFAGKRFSRLTRHEFLFRRLVTCTGCGYSLIGERQKGHVYYRCHSRTCDGVSVREEVVDAQARHVLREFSLTEEQLVRIREELPAVLSDNTRLTPEKDTSAIALAQIQERLSRLTDAYINATIDEEAYLKRKEALLLERRGVDDVVVDPIPTISVDEVAAFLELAKSAEISYEMAANDEKRDLLLEVTSNRVVEEKKPVFTLSSVFTEVANTRLVYSGAPRSGTARTRKRVLKKLVKAITSRILEVRSSRNYVAGQEFRWSRKNDARAA